MSNLILREATENDVHLLFKWANDKAVRENSFSNEPIKWHDHLNWFSNKLKEDKSKIFILSLSNSEIGQIRFDRLEDSNWLINYSIDKSFRGHGYGSKIVELAINSFKKASKFTAKVKKSNPASAKVFRKLGFNEEITKEGDYVYKIENISKKS